MVLANALLYCVISNHLVRFAIELTDKQYKYKLRLQYALAFMAEEVHFSTYLEQKLYFVRKSL